MSEENVELARRMVEWFNARDAAAAQAHSTDDVEIVPLRAAIEDTTYRGPDAFASFDADSGKAWESLYFEVDELREAVIGVVAIGHLSARARVTGADITTRFAVVLEIRGGELSKLQTFFDVDEALEAAGLSE